MANSKLQGKLDKMLAKGISDVKALGIELYDIIPDVRITNNTRRIGSAQDVHNAITKVFGTTQIVSGRTPLFQISISRRECSNDQDIKNVLYHEILHCAPNCQDHQATWKGHAAKVNAAYGLNVTTTKDVRTPAEKTAGAADVKGFVGKCFRDGARTFEFTGFNSRPKNSCDITDVATGKRYVCPPGYIAKKMEESPCLFGASTTAKSPAAKPSSSQFKEAARFVGKKVKNGPRGRKVFTVVSVEPAAGKKAITLLDENGCEYTGPIGCATRFVVVG